MTSIPPRDRKNKNASVDIYRAYVQAKARGGSIGDVLLRYGISRSNLYEVIRKVRYGNPWKVKKDTEKARLAALWEHKYRFRFLALPKNRVASTVEELRALIREMDKDGFPQAVIAARIGKDRSTVIHHLDN